MKKRPIFLNLFAIHFPITAIASILHRLSGVFLFLLIPVILWWLRWSLGPTAAEDVEKFSLGFYTKGFIWLGLSAFFYHLIAGLRHIMMDMGWCDSWHAGRISAQMVIVLSILYSLAVGYWLWF